MPAHGDDISDVSRAVLDVGWYSGAATIRQGEREVQVSCEIREKLAGGDAGWPSWDGSWFWPDPDHALETGSATISLPDRREAQIIVCYVSAGVAGQYGQLAGEGPLPG